ncbi:MAG: 5-oxoprolinase subunit PxpA [Verrucomicrobiota bacterium]
MTKRIDLNCDLGEGMGHDAELMPLITSANIACGAHAGDLESMIETVELAIKRHVNVGAHPGYFDLHNFGRTERAVNGPEAGRLVLMQLEQLFEVAGDQLKHVKLHGALYNQVSRDPYLAETVATDLGRLWPDLMVYALAGSAFAQAARSRGLRVAEEFFADRTYQANGTLTPRTQPNALITDEDVAVAQVLQMMEKGTVRTADGREIALKADTICLHGDAPQAVAFAARLRRELKAAGVVVKAFAG